MKLGLSATAALAVIGTLGVSGCASWRETAAERAYPPTGEFVDVDGVRIHVHVEGEGPDLVILHGASGNTRDYTEDFLPLVRD
ncbi:MAG: alpha/beta hydrolase, partial [Pseudomonadota bacterium]